VVGASFVLFADQVGTEPEPEPAAAKKSKRRVASSGG
jgi:hypothetical protein